MGVPPGNRTAGLVSVPKRYVAGTNIRERQEGRPYPWSQQVIHEISGLDHILIRSFGQFNFCPLTIFSNTAGYLQLEWNVLRTQISKVFKVHQPFGTNSALASIHP
jgi:hypothetical protein